MLRAVIRHHNVHVVDTSANTLKEYLDEEEIFQILGKVEQRIFDTVSHMSDTVGEPWTSRASSFNTISGWWHEQVESMFAKEFVQRHPQTSGLALFDTLSEFADSFLDNHESSPGFAPTAFTAFTASTASTLNPASTPNPASATPLEKSNHESAPLQQGEDAHSVATSAVNDWVKEFQNQPENDIHSILDDFEKMQQQDL